MSIHPRLRQLVRFLLTGVVNTAVGLGTVLFLLHVAGLPDVVANIAGYAIGLCVSFALNRRWTFASTRSVRSTVPRFLVVVAVAYGANLATMLFLNRHWGWSIDWANLCAVVPYTVVFYIGSRWFVFRDEAPSIVDGGRLIPAERGAR